MKPGLTLIFVLLLGSCRTNSNEVKTEKGDLYTTEIIDDFEYRLYNPCSDSIFNMSAQKNVINHLDTELLGTEVWICKTDTFNVQGNEVVFLWKRKEWAQPSQNPKNWNNTYPPNTYFTWWGCVDSIYLNGKGKYNPIRTGQLPTLMKVYISYKTTLNDGVQDTAIVFSIDSSAAQGFHGIQISF